MSTILLGKLLYTLSIRVCVESVTLVGEVKSCEKFRLSIFLSHDLAEDMSLKRLTLKSYTL